MSILLADTATWQSAREGGSLLCEKLDGILAGYPGVESCGTVTVELSSFTKVALLEEIHLYWITLSMFLS
jgi:hypothetical protein